MSKYNLLAISKLSKDNSTKVSAIISNKHGSIISFGYNGLPRGMNDENPDYQNKDLDFVDENGLKLHKYDLFEHAERNALYNYVRENSKLVEDGNYIIMPSIDSMEDARCIASIGVKHVYTRYISDKIVDVMIHLFEQCGVTVSFIDDYFQDYQHMVNCSSYTLAKLRQSTTQSNKIKSLFDCLDELYSDTETTKYAAIFSKNNSLISIGRFGFSDLLQSKFEAKLNDENITIEQKYKLEQLIQDHLYYKAIDDKNPIQVGQSAIKNAVYNLLTDKTDFTDYKIEVSLSPCLLCYIGLLSCGFQPKNILVNAQALQQTANINTMQRWKNEHDVGQMLAELIS